MEFFKSINYASFFELRPFTPTATLKWYAGIFGLFILIGLCIKVYQYVIKTDKFWDKLLQKYFSFFAIIGSIGGALVWLRYERVQLFAARYVLIAWIIAGAYWLYTIIMYQIKILPQAKKQAEEKKLLQKYLPKRK